MRLLMAMCVLALVGSAALVLAKEKPAKAPPSEDVMTLAKDSNAFATGLYQQLREKEGNLFFSPGSVYTALGMLYAGARGDTAAEMGKAMHVTLPGDKLNPAFADLAKLMNPPASAKDDAKGDKAKERAFQLSIANALWPQVDYAFKADYLATTGKYFNAELTGLDYRKEAEASRKKINAWVEKKTNDKIKDLIPQGVLTADTRLVLTNAIYFKGNWKDPFKKEDTKDESFSGVIKRGDAVAEGTKVPMMHRTGHYGYLKGDGFAAVELPYAGDELSMQVFLPEKVGGLADFEKQLTADNLAKWTFRSREVQLSLPKFKMTREVTLNDPLKAMGMRLVFTEKADLSGMAGSPGELCVTAVLHKAFVDVNEEGTEAAGATGIVVGITCMPPPPVEFKADHPFVFLIRHTATGEVLFAGRVVDPTGDGK